MEVIYLTGAPAAGKSSLTASLRDAVPELQIFEFGEQLTRYINEINGTEYKQSDLRSLSSNIVRTEHVRLVDEKLIEFVDAHRDVSPIIIDSHPVTKEEYGFRITPFSLARFERLRPTRIWMLFTPPTVVLERIRADALGRPSISEEEARMHTYIQASVAATYAAQLGIAAELIDSSGSRDDLTQRLAARLRSH